MKIHKNAKDQTPCGIPCWKNAKRATEWSIVTCNSCLKNKPTWKIPPLPKTDNLEEVFAVGARKENNLSSINEDLNALDWTTEQQELDTAVEKEQPKTPFDKWQDWFVLCCDHSISPQSHEVWDGAIDTICMYLLNEMCSELGLDETNRILNKAKKKFKT